MNFNLTRRRKPIKMLLNLTYDVNADETKNLSKLSPLLSQMGVYEANLIDIFIERFIEKLEFDKHVAPLLKIKLPVIIDIFRKRQKTGFTVINPTLPDLLKKFSDRRAYFYTEGGGHLFRVPYFYVSKLEFFKVFLINFYLVYNYYSINLFTKLLQSMRGIMLSVRVRRQMKKRKINFRRKHGKYKR